MKVYVNGPQTNELKAILRVVKLEGDTIVESAKDADIVLQGEGQSSLDHPYVIGGSYNFPPDLVESFDFLCNPSGKQDVLLTKWFDFEKGWSKQLFVGLPLIGMMNEGLGTPIPTGLAGRFVNGSQLSELFKGTALKNVLQEMAYRGFVSFSTSPGMHFVFSCCKESDQAQHPVCSMHKPFH